MNLSNGARRIIAVLFLVCAATDVPTVVAGIRGHARSDFFFIGDLLMGAVSLGLAVFFWFGPKSRSSREGETHDRSAPTAGA